MLPVQPAMEKHKTQEHAKPAILVMTIPNGKCGQARYPDYAHWYGWNMMMEDLGEVKELAGTMRATHKK